MWKPWACLRLQPHCWFLKAALSHEASFRPTLTLAVMEVPQAVLKLREKCCPPTHCRGFPLVLWLPCWLPPEPSQAEPNQGAFEEAAAWLPFLCPPFSLAPTVSELLKESIIVMKLQPAMRADSPQEHRRAESVPAFPDGSEMLGLELAQGVRWGREQKGGL